MWSQCDKGNFETPHPGKIFFVHFLEVLWNNDKCQLLQTMQQKMQKNCLSISKFCQSGNPPAFVRLTSNFHCPFFRNPAQIRGWPIFLTTLRGPVHIWVNSVTSTVTASQVVFRIIYLEKRFNLLLQHSQNAQSSGNCRKLIFCVQANVPAYHGNTSTLKRGNYQILGTQIAFSFLWNDWLSWNYEMVDRMTTGI